MAEAAQPQPQVEVRLPGGGTVPTYYSNLVQTQLIEDEVSLDFCIRAADRPHEVADLQCRVITTAAHVRRLAQGLLALLGEHERMLRREAGAGGGGGAGGRGRAARRRDRRARRRRIVMAQNVTPTSTWNATSPALDMSPAFSTRPISPEIGPHDALTPAPR